MSRAAALLVILLSAQAFADGKPAALLLGVRDREGALATYFLDGKRIEKLGEGLALPTRRGWKQLQIVRRKEGESTFARLWIGAPGARPPPPKSDNDDCEVNEEVTLQFASGEHAGVDSSEGRSCKDAAHPTAIETMAMRPISDAADAASIGELLGADVGRAFEQAWKDARDKSDHPDCLAEDPDQSAWSLAFAGGRWIVRGLVARTSEACRGQEVQFDAAGIAVPAKLSGSDGLAAPNGAIKLDAAEIEKLGAVVMTQWALGKSVERWRKEARAALSAP